MHRNFFWNQSAIKNSTPLISWEKVCRPKNMGGLGLRKTLPMNKAFLAKLTWKILTDNNSIWANLARKKYLSNSNFFQYNPKQNDSKIWRHILSQREIIRKGIRWKIGNGHSTNFWLDNWVLKIDLASFLNKNINDINPHLRVADFITLENTWDTAKLSTVLPIDIVQKV